MDFIERKIKKTREKLNNMVTKDLKSKGVLKISKKLDKLVVKYYKKKEGRKYGTFKDFIKI